MKAQAPSPLSLPPSPPPPRYRVSLLHSPAERKQVIADITASGPLDDPRHCDLRRLHLGFVAAAKKAVPSPLPPPADATNEAGDEDTEEGEDTVDVEEGEEEEEEDGTSSVRINLALRVAFDLACDAQGAYESATDGPLPPWATTPSASPWPPSSPTTPNRSTTTSPVPPTPPASPLLLRQSSSSTAPSTPTLPPSARKARKRARYKKTRLARRQASSVPSPPAPLSTPSSSSGPLLPGPYLGLPLAQIVPGNKRARRHKRPPRFIGPQQQRQQRQQVPPLQQPAVPRPPSVFVVPVLAKGILPFFRLDGYALMHIAQQTGTKSCVTLL